jgi:predicted RecA/RadA family phage recombinase
MGTTFKQPGKIVTLTAPAGGVTSGVGIQIGQLFVVPQVTAAQGELFTAETEGVHVLPKLSAQAWTEGALIYWDSTPGECTTTATGNLLIGCAVAVAANPSSTGKVRLNGTAVVQS